MSDGTEQGRSEGKQNSTGKGREGWSESEVVRGEGEWVVKGRNTEKWRD